MQNIIIIIGVDVCTNNCIGAGIQMVTIHDRIPKLVVSYLACMTVLII
jgi:hypothetical protein